jgi:acetyl esterase
LLLRRLQETRRHVGAFLTDGFFNGASRLGRLHPRARLERHGVERIVDVAYGEGPDHVLDVYRPRDGGPWPVVFYVHGGGFRILSKDTHWLMALAYARRGFVVFNVNYRLAPKHRYPCAVEDVHRAFAWVVAHASRFGGDPSRIVLAGESAGANLVAGLAVSLCYRRDEPHARAVFETGVVPRAVVPACGVFQVSDIRRLERRKPRMSSFIMDRLAEVEEAYLGGDPECSRDLADPLCVLERGEAPARPLPPFFLPVGTRDPLLPDTRRMAAALRKLGAIAEDRYYPGEVHAFHAFVMRPRARECWTDTFAFLERHLSIRLNVSPK